MDEKRIIIAEDDEILGNLIKESLESNGYTVALVTNGKEALEEIKKIPCSILITDIEMPEMDGYELIVHLQEMEFQPLIFVVTGNNESSFIIDVMKKGVYDYILKPLNIEDFLMKVDRAYETYQLRRIKSISEKEKDLRLENQMEWLQWQQKNGSKRWKN
jgi:DNA-binding response OmpR family regulator